jgi:hypothetical protein
MMIERLEKIKKPNENCDDWGDMQTIRKKAMEIVKKKIHDNTAASMKRM